MHKYRVHNRGGAVFSFLAVRSPLPFPCTGFAACGCIRGPNQLFRTTLFRLRGRRIRNVIVCNALRQRVPVQGRFADPKNRLANALGMLGECWMIAPRTSLECTHFGPDTSHFGWECAQSGFFVPAHTESEVYGTTSRACCFET